MEEKERCYSFVLSRTPDVTFTVNQRNLGNVPFNIIQVYVYFGEIIKELLFYLEEKSDVNVECVITNDPVGYFRIH
jgi:hypothetical protein